MKCFTCLSDDSQCTTYTVAMDEGKAFEFHLCMACVAIAQYYFIAICDKCQAVFWVNYDKRLVHPRLLFTSCENMGRKILCKRGVIPCGH